MFLCRLQVLPTILQLLIFFGCTWFGASSPIGKFPISADTEEGLLSWRRNAIEEISPPPLAVNNTHYVLAGRRTYRKDPTDDFNKYRGGWNISDVHYWASVGFTAVPLFLIALIWFVGFALILLLICCCYCCFRRHEYGYSRTAYALSLIFLILFTIAAIIGCVVLYTGQGKFHGSTEDTLDYVVSQSAVTVEKLNNFSKALATAKSTGVVQLFLPSDLQAKIDDIGKKLNGSASDLAVRTKDNSRNIRDLLDTVRLFLIVVAAVMLLLAFLGFFFSVVGPHFLVYFLVLIGWVLVAGTFILCGVFLLLHNVVADTCIAMDEWVLHPSEHTALDDIIPCVSVATANESLYQSKAVTYQMVNMVDQAISSICNRNFPAMNPPLSYNQSGPLMPLLCNPFGSNLASRNCTAGEVNFDNAPQTWAKYVCNVSASDTCITTGRLTPDIYRQMTAATSLSHAIYSYSPFLVGLEDCSFVRVTFSTIHSQGCPGLRRYSKWIYIGLVMVSAAVMLSLLFWVIYARERRHRRNTKLVDRRLSQDPFQDKGQ